ncbi:MAG: hypothetical protein K0S46_2449 [Moraxellaceae bacterium]|jgi:TPR repeat protein|nr:hypothetical protein [Moraxellaceae bacterium]
MNRISRIALSSLLLIAVAGTARAGGDADLLAQSDAIAGTEAPALRARYEAGNEAFARGDFAAAFRDYDYAAWQGSVAAASRLCVLDAYGIGTTPNPVKAAFWCERSAEAGHELAGVQRYLAEDRVVGP